MSVEEYQAKFLALDKDKIRVATEQMLKRELVKAEWDVTKEELIERAKMKLTHCDGEAIIANDLSRTDSGFDMKYCKHLALHLLLYHLLRM